MKKTNKIILGSVLTMILCVSLIAGSTFALFSSETKTNIAVTSGTVRVSATIDESSLKLYSYSENDDGTYESTERTGDDSKTFYTGGTVRIESGTIMLDNMMPGDKVTFDIAIDNQSTVAIKYKPSVSCADASGLELYSMLNKTFKTGSENDDVDFNTWKKVGASEEISDINVTIELPRDFGEEVQGLSTTLVFSVEAVQGNGETEDVVVEESSSLDELKAAIEKLADGEIGEIDLTGNIDVTEASEREDFASSGILLDEGTDLVIEGNGNMITLSHTAFNYYTPFIQGQDYGFNQEGVLSGTLVFKDIRFKAANRGEGYVLVLGMNSTAHVVFENCIFEDMYTAIYCNQNVSGDATIEIRNCTYIDTKWGYSIETLDNETIEVIFEDNTGNYVKEQEDFNTSFVESDNVGDIKDALESGKDAFVDLTDDIDVSNAGVEQRPQDGLQLAPGADLTIDGHDRTITLDHTAFNAWDINEGIRSGTIVIKNVHFKATNKGQGYALTLGFDSTANVTFEDCVFEDMYTAIYCNRNDNGNATVEIRNCEYRNTDWGYGLSEPDNLGDTIEVIFDNNEGDYLSELEVLNAEIVEGDDVDSVKDALVSGNDAYVDLTGDIDVSDSGNEQRPKDGLQLANGANLTIDGHDQIIELDHTAFNSWNGNEGILSGTIVIKNVHFKGKGENEGYAMTLGFDSTAHVIFENCTFENMYTAIYCNQNDNGNATVEIRNCTYTNTKYGYSVYDPNSSNKVKVIFEDNDVPEDNFTQEETFDN